MIVKSIEFIVEKLSALVNKYGLLEPIVGSVLDEHPQLKRILIDVEDDILTMQASNGISLSTISLAVKSAGDCSLLVTPLFFAVLREYEREHAVKSVQINEHQLKVTQGRRKNTFTFTNKPGSGFPNKALLIRGKDDNITPEYRKIENVEQLKQSLSIAYSIAIKNDNSGGVNNFYKNIHFSPDGFVYAGDGRVFCKATIPTVLHETLALDQTRSNLEPLYKIIMYALGASTNPEWCIGAGSSLLIRAKNPDIQIVVGGIRSTNTTKFEVVEQFELYEKRSVVCTVSLPRDDLIKELELCAVYERQCLTDIEETAAFTFISIKDSEFTLKIGTNNNENKQTLVLDEDMCSGDYEMRCLASRLLYQLKQVRTSMIEFSFFEKKNKDDTPMFLVKPYVYKDSSIDTDKVYKPDSVQLLMIQ